MKCAVRTLEADREDMRRDLLAVVDRLKSDSSPLTEDEKVTVRAAVIFNIVASHMLPPDIVNTILGRCVSVVNSVE